MITLPTLSELNAQNIADIEAKYSTTLPVIGKSFLRTWAGVMAGSAWVLYMALGKVQKNIFADTCDYETLVRFGRVKLGRNPYPATAGYYYLIVTGSIGATIPISTTFKSDDDSANPSKLFILDTSFTFVATTGVIYVRALEAGIDSRLEIGDTLTATAPIALVDQVATVQIEDTIPISAETEDIYREKVIQAFRLEPQGGAGADYRLWAADVQEVRQSYPYAAMGFTEVNLYIEATIADSTDGKGTPSGTTLTDVESAIEDPTVDRPSRKPILDVVNYLPVTPLDIDITITGLVGATAEIETAITDALGELLQSIRPFISSIDVLANKNDILNNFKIVGVILEAYPGAIFDSVDFQVDAAPSVSFTFANSNIPYLNSITFA